MWMGKTYPAVFKQIVVQGILGFIALSFSVFLPWGNSTVMPEEAFGMNRTMDRILFAEIV
jgi:hypothetical protein